MRSLRRLLQNRSAVIGLAIIVLYIVMAIFGALTITPFPPNEQHPKPADRLQPPSDKYIMGSDQFGRDIFSRVIRGTIYSVRVALISVAIATMLGTAIGMISGYVGGTFDTLIMRIMDVFFAFPAILLALAVVSSLGPGPNNAIPAIAVVYTPIFARVARAPVLAVKSMEYVTAARCIGMRDWRILFRHVMPNALAPVIVTISLALSWALLTEAGLSFLGLGPQPPEPSWGLMLKDGRNLMEVAPWLVIFPGLAIMLGVLGFNLLGDGLRDVFDPRLRR
ncbi:MAG: ABC transporter permease [Anaerolineae bacterium]|nr:ABC transporter permease [Anaerolineae bacterium]